MTVTDGARRRRSRGTGRAPTLIDVLERLARIETRLDAMATKEDLARFETRTTGKSWGTLFAILPVAPATAARVRLRT